MQMKTNCPNCGAALPQFGGKCVFCGTRVVDLTMLDFDAHEPTMFLLNLPQSITGGQKATISMWAQPELNSITMESNSIEIYSGFGHHKLATVSMPQVGFEISLHPRHGPNSNHLYELKIDN